MRDFLGLAAAVIARDPGLAPCRATVEKELLHMEILEALRGIRAFPRLAFKGGTCLRLCRQGKRLSEDLGFAAGRDFDAAMMDDLERVLRDRIASAYGLEVTDPAQLRSKGPRYPGSVGCTGRHPPVA